MGDSQRANRRFTGYGPITSTLCCPWSSRTIVASPLPFLARVMTVFVFASFAFGFCGACFAPFGPCMVHEDGHVLSSSLAFRNAASVAVTQNSSSAVGLCDSACRHRALHSSSPCSASSSPRPHHLGGGGRTIALVPPIWGWGQDNPTPFMVGQNDKVIFGVVHVPSAGSPKSLDRSVSNPGSPKIWDRSVSNPGSPNFLDRSVSRFFSSRLRARSLDADLRVGEV